MPTVIASEHYADAIIPNAAAVAHLDPNATKGAYTVMRALSVGACEVKPDGMICIKGGLALGHADDVVGRLDAKGDRAEALLTRLESEILKSRDPVDTPDKQFRTNKPVRPRLN